MKTLYLQCHMGAAGDMLTAALLELTEDPAGVLSALNGAGIPGVVYQAVCKEQCGICGTHVIVTVAGKTEESHQTHSRGASHAVCQAQVHYHHHHHAHATLGDISALLAGLRLPPKVKEKALAVYQSIAEAESKAHGQPVELVHFHEVGAMDAVADVTAVCYLMELLAPDAVVVSPVHTGSGTVQCAHGVLPVPTPATAWLLRGIPLYSDGTQGELCTPTGAALLRAFATEFGPMPVMRTEKIGYGMGTKSFETANCVRAFLGDTGQGNTSPLTELSCNLDDMTGEDIAFATQRLRDAGAKEVYTTAIQMKKNRPGVQLTLQCVPSQAEEFAALLFRYTTTLGVRRADLTRYMLTRRSVTVVTSLGPVPGKVASGFGVTREKWEHDALERLAQEQDIAPAEVARQLGQIQLENK